MKDEEIGTLVVSVMGLLMLPLAFVWHAYALSTMWGWFVVSAFDVAPLSKLTAFGIALMITFSTHQHSDAVEKEREGVWRALAPIFRTWATPAVMLGIGWLGLQIAG